MSEKKIQLQAQLDPSVKTAVGFDTHGAGYIRLAFPATEMVEAMRLAAFGVGKVFKIGISLEGVDENGKRAAKKKTFSG